MVLVMEIHNSCRMLGALFGESIRKVAPTAAFYAPMMGVGFVFLGFSQMLEIAKEPMMCLIPLLFVFNGFFGGVRYKLYKTLGFFFTRVLLVIFVICVNS